MAPPGKAEQQWPARSHVSLFVRSLHLLDLDKSQDWPGLTEQSFAAKANLQQRIKAIEWSLYRLFEVFDARLTQDKLRPFFPPTAPLQSVNLRAAFFRQLTELKKIGVLNKDVQLRKTMFDECKGDKFEEAVASFAMFVLRKAFSERGCSRPSTSTQLPDHQVVPMILAYRSSLQHELRKAEALREQASASSQLTGAKLQDLERIKSEVRSHAPSTPVTEEEKARVEEMIRSNWLAASEWADVVLGGCIPPQQLGSDALSSMLSDSVHQEPRAMPPNQVLLNDLVQRVQAQQRQLKEWKSILKTIQSRQRSSSVPTPDQSRLQTTASTARFTKHSNSTSNGEQTIYPETLPKLHPAYESLIQSMNRELREATRHAREPHLFSKEAEVDKTQGPLSTAVSLSRSSRNVPQPETMPLSPLASRDLQSSSQGKDPSLDVPQQAKSSSSTSTPTPDKQSSLPAVRPTHNPMSLEKNDLKTINETSQLEDLTEQASIETALPTTSTPISANLASDSSDKHSSLIERTRQSLSVLGSTQKQRQTNDRAKNESSRRNVARPSHVRGGSRDQPLDGTGADQDKTLSSVDSLLEDETDYQSVFKSRPKIALSPQLSPTKSPKAASDFSLK